MVFRQHTEFDESSAHTTGDAGVLTLGVQTTTEGALGDNNQYVPLQLDASGRLRTAPSTIAAPNYTLINGPLTAFGEVYKLGISNIGQ